ncbi:MAG: integrin alpha, partial [Candidatus Poseidoniales archaeon]
FMNTDGSVDSTVEINSSTTNGPTLSDGDSFGRSVANIGDLDGDGMSDLAVGAYFDNAGGSQRGAVHILFMNAGQVVEQISINKSITQSITESLLLSHSNIAAGGFNVYPNESLALTSGISENSNIGNQITESISFVDSVTRITEINSAETLSFSDSVSRQTTLGLSDTLLVTDSTITSKITVNTISESIDFQLDDPWFKPHMRLVDGTSYGGTTATELYNTKSGGYFEIGGNKYVAVAAYSDRGITVFDITDPDNPIVTDNLTTTDYIWDMDIFTYDDSGTTKTYAVLAGYIYGTIALVDLSDPSNLVEQRWNYVATPGTSNGNPPVNGTRPTSVAAFTNAYDLGVKSTTTIANIDNDNFGQDVTAIGDLDGDGVTDLIVGNPRATYGCGSCQYGSIYVLLMNSNGSVKSSNILWFRSSGAPTLSQSDAFGWGVEKIGTRQVAVGAPGDDAGGGNRGAIHILNLSTSGGISSTSEINDNTSNGPTLSDGDQFGYAIANMGDLDGDGVRDLAVGAPFDDGSQSDTGAVHILFMNSNNSVKSTVQIN